MQGLWLFGTIIPEPVVELPWTEVRLWPNDVKKRVPQLLWWMWHDKPISCKLLKENIHIRNASRVTSINLREAKWVGNGLDDVRDSESERRDGFWFKRDILHGLACVIFKGAGPFRKSIFKSLTCFLSQLTNVFGGLHGFRQDWGIMGAGFSLAHRGCWLLVSRGTS